MEKLTSLTALYVNSNQLMSLDVSKNILLEKMFVSNNQLTSLDVSKNTLLAVLIAKYNQLESLNVGDNMSLESLQIDNNQLTSLDVSKNTSLIELSVYNNQLTNLDISKNSALEYLYVNSNQLTSLDVSKNTALIDLYASKNKLTSLDVSKNAALEYLYVSYNKLKTVDVSKNLSLLELGVYDNQLISLDVSKNLALIDLSVGDNQLTSLNVSNNKELKWLIIDNNQLTSIDVSKNLALIDFKVYNNQLKSLNLNNNKLLKTLLLYNNQLTSLNMSDNINLESLSIRDNPYNENLYMYRDDTITIGSNVVVPSHLNWDSPIWTSKNENIVIVDENGLVTAKSIGTADIDGVVTDKYTTTSTINVVEITSDKYEIDEKNNYIFIDGDNDADIIKNNIIVSNDNITLDINLDTYKLYVKYNSEILKTFNIIGFSSEKYNLSKEFIYVGTSSVDLEKIDTINCYEEIRDNKLLIKYNDEVVKYFDIIGFSSEEYDLSKEYIYVGNGNIDLEKINNINCDEEINDNKLIIKFSEEVLKEYQIVSISSTDYDLNKEYIYVGNGTLDLDKINNINCDEDIKENKLLIKYNNEVLDEYLISSISSTKYDLSKEYIYVGNNIKLDKINNINCDKEVKDSKLIIKYGEEILDEYELINFNINNYNVFGNNIILLDEVLYDEFISNIVVSDGITYKIFNGKNEVTSGNIFIDYILKIYYNGNEIDEYIFTNEYLHFDDSLNIKDDNIIVNIKGGTSIEEVKSKINTSGEVSILDKDNNVIEDITNKNIGTGYKFKIEMSSNVIEYIVSVRGDVTGDGLVNINDVIQVSKHVIKGNVLSGSEYINAADVNSSDTVDINDVIKLARHIVKKEEL